MVTGAGAGIGAAVATALATEGWLVVLAGRRLAPLQDASRRSTPTCFSIPSQPT